MKINGSIEIDETSEEFDNIRKEIRKELIDDLKSELDASEIADILIIYGRSGNGAVNLCEILKTVVNNMSSIYTEDDYTWDYQKTAFKKLLAIKNILDI